MEITLDWLKEKNACQVGINWFKKQNKSNHIEVLEFLIQNEKYQWANWLIIRTMDRKQYTQYAIFSAEQVIDIFEKKYPNDNRPRKAIEAAKNCLTNNFSTDAAAAYAAAYTAANSAANSAYAATVYAADATVTASLAADAADGADAIAAAADATKNKMQIKFLNYGMELIKNEAIHAN